MRRENEWEEQSSKQGEELSRRISVHRETGEELGSKYFKQEQRRDKETIPAGDRVKTKLCPYHCRRVGGGAR